MLCCTLWTALLTMLLNHQYCCNLLGQCCWTINIVATCLNKLQQYWWFNNIVNNAVHGVQHNIVHSCFEQLATTWWFLRVLHGKKLIRLSQQEWTMLCCTPWTALLTMLLSLVEPSMLLQLVGLIVNKLQQYWWFNNIVNNAVHGVQHNIVHSCFEQLATTWWFLRVYTEMDMDYDHQSFA